MEIALTGSVHATHGEVSAVGRVSIVAASQRSSKPYVFAYRTLENKSVMSIKGNKHTRKQIQVRSLTHLKGKGRHKQRCGWQSMGGASVFLAMPCDDRRPPES